MEEFSVQQSITYDFFDNLEAKVTYTINLTNQTALLFAKEYSLKIDGSPIYDVQAFDSTGNILKSATDNSLNLEFSSPALGKDKVKNFTISYKQKGLVKERGQVHEISLPSLENPYTTQTQVTLRPPDAWGDLAQQSIPLHNQSFTTNSRSIDKSVFSFGRAQILEYQLDYFLKNDSNTLTTKTIPLPPDTALQRIKLTSINPRPKNITADPDGNWLASYELQPYQELTVSLSGVARIAQNSDYVHNANPSYLKSLTTSNQVWPQLLTKQSSPKEVYRTVVTTLDYDYQRASSPSEQSLLTTLQNPTTAICTDFTNYFIALSRSNGIPSRQIIGYALTNNQSIKPLNQNADILHTWPEYFDSSSGKWLDVDPTWGKTTGGVDYFSSIDLNHLAFIIRGQSPAEPLPPGSYKSLKSPRTVTVNYSKAPFELEQKELVKSIIYTGFFTQKQKIYNPNLNSISLLPPLSSTTLDYPILSFQNYRLVLFLALLLVGVIILIRKLYEKNT